MSTQTSTGAADLAWRAVAVLGLIGCALLLWFGGSWIVRDLSNPDAFFSGIAATMAWLFLVAPAVLSTVVLGRFLRNGRRELLAVGLMVLLVPLVMLQAWG